MKKYRFDLACFQESENNDLFSNIVLPGVPVWRKSGRMFLLFVVMIKLSYNLTFFTRIIQNFTSFVHS